MIQALCGKKSLIDTLQKGSSMLLGMPGELPTGVPTMPLPLPLAACCICHACHGGTGDTGPCGAEALTPGVTFPGRWGLRPVGVSCILRGNLGGRKPMRLKH